MIRILLADDQALIRSGIRSLLEAEDDIEVVAEAADGQHAVALAAEHRPDIALVDIQMPVLDGLEATRQIVADERLDSVRVVILTNFGLDEYIFRALRAGASGFLLKDTQPAELLQALRVVMRGDALLSPAVTRRLISEFVARPPDAVAAAGMETLTNREREVVALAAHGLSNDEIADAMVLSPATAKTHVSRAMIKLGARDRAQLVVFAYQTGLVAPRAAGPLTSLSLASQFRRWLPAWRPLSYWPRCPRRLPTETSTRLTLAGAGHPISRAEYGPFYGVGEVVCCCSAAGLTAGDQPRSAG